jgi:flavodoxin
MNYQVIYFSRKGNTRKIAQAIASQIGVHVEDVETAQLLDDRFVFLGSGCYGSKPSHHITQFIENNTFESRDIALFGTSASGEGKEVEEMQRLLKDKKAHIKGRFFCKGKFLFSNRDRPNEHDIADAKNFAQEMINK